MSEVPNNLYYTKTHEWVKKEGDGTVKVGITDHAQDLLGDMVYVELPGLNFEVHAGDECGVVESVKAASDVYCPVSGKIVEVNNALSKTPEHVNKDPYGNGWIFRLRVAEEGELAELLDATAYEEQIATET